MTRAIAFALLFAVAAQPALAKRSASTPASVQTVKAAQEQRTKGAAIHEPARTCKKYFAVVGAVISVPC